MLEHKKVVISVLILFGAYLVDYFFFHSEENTTLNIKHGQLKGKISKSRDGRDFYEFLGIPYAEPPIGKLRFLSPKPAKSWTGLRDATKCQSKCMQIDVLTNVKGGSEDCLYLNVFSPKTSGMPSLFPVIVYLHGGDFMDGRADIFGPRYFMDADVILVTVNYRLGSLGFLNAGNKYARGNMGLKDQVAALKWVQENIQYFSGDPKRVILMGQGAGASSAHLHMLSRMSSGLFHGIISSSGTASSPFILQHDPVPQARRLGKKLKCPSSRKTEPIVACLGQAEVQRLVEGQRETVIPLRDPITMYGPSVELIEDEDSFLPRDPVDMLRLGEVINQVPVLMGVTSNEGLAVATRILRNSSMIQELEQNWQKNTQKLLRYETEAVSIHNRVLEFYLGSYEGRFLSQEKSKDGLAKLIGDRKYYVPTHNSVLVLGKMAPVYLYQFSQPAPMSYADIIHNQNDILPPVVEVGTYLAYKWITRLFGSDSPSSGEKEVSHFDDQTFFFNIPYMPEYTAEHFNYELSKELINAWVSFAKNGKPTSIKGVTWNPVDPRPKVLQKYMEISERPKIVEEPFAERVKFWNSLNLR